MAVLWILGFCLLFVGERWAWATSAHWPFTGLGILLIVGSIVGRAFTLADKDAARAAAKRNSLIFAAVGTSSALFYLLAQETVTGMLGLSDEAVVRWYACFIALVPITWLLGGLPMTLIDIRLIVDPVSLPRRAGQQAIENGLICALALCIIFPLNYLATIREWTWNTNEVRVTRAGESTIAVVRTLAEPVHITLFYPSGNEVKDAIEPYFEELVSASAGQLTVEVLDQALSPTQSEDFKIKENGWVVFRASGEPEKFKLNTEIDSAKRDLKKLDSLVQKNLIKLTRGPRKIVFLTGHDEGGPKTRDDGWRKLAQLKRRLQDQSYKVDDMGLAEGSADAIPDDVDVLVIAGPMQPLLAEEVAAIGNYIDTGGSLLLFVASEGDPMDGVLAKLGLKAEAGPLADDTHRLAKGPPHILYTDRYGTHVAVHSLSTKQVPLILPVARPIAESGDYAGKRTVLVRTYAESWNDLDKNGKVGPDEAPKVYEVGYAVEGPGEPDEAARAVVFGDIEAFSDNALNLFGDAGWILARDSTKWLTRDEDIVGDVASEEDVKIQHRAEGQTMWFLGTIFLVPALVLGGGGAWSFARRWRKA